MKFNQEREREEEKEGNVVISAVNRFVPRVNYGDIQYSVVLTFKSVDKILWCDHSKETSSPVVLHGIILFFIFYKMKFGIFLEF